MGHTFSSFLLVLAIVATLLVAPAFITGNQAHAAPAPSTTGVLFSLYKYPGSYWDQMISYRNAHPDLPWIAVINPSSGPGSSPSSTFVNYIAKLKAANVIVVGYVPTLYASRSSGDVQSDIAKYWNWYKIDGVFLDTMSNKPGFEGYYRSMTTYAKSLGMNFVVGNPGADVPSTYVGTVDNIIIWERSGVPPLDRLAGWHTNYDKSNFSFVSHSQPTLDSSYVVSATKYVKYMLITDGVMPNPYFAFPSYFNQELAALDSAVGTSSSPPPAPSTASITVKSANLSGTQFTGMYTTIKTSSGTTVKTGFTTLTYAATPGATYVVTPQDYQNYKFDHWDNGSTIRARSITPASDTSITAYYQTG